MTWLSKIGRLGSGFCLLVVLLGCGSPDAKSRQLYETAQLEEQQNNPQHAKQLYEEVIREYPESPFAVKAKERLKSLEEKPAP